MGFAGWGEARVSGQRLAVELRRLRDLSGLSGRELAQRVGIRQSKVSRIESGSAIPTSPEVTAWADAVEAPPETRELLLELTEQALTEIYAWKGALRNRTHLQDDVQQREREASRIYSF